MHPTTRLLVIGEQDFLAKVKSRLAAEPHFILLHVLPPDGRAALLTNPSDAILARLIQPHFDGQEIRTFLLENNIRARQLYASSSFESLNQTWATPTVRFAPYHPAGWTAKEIDFLKSSADNG